MINREASNSRPGEPSPLLRLPKFILSHALSFLSTAELHQVVRACSALQTLTTTPLTSRQQRGDADWGRECGRSQGDLFVVADPHTLLARLNTRRLRKRIKYLQKNGQLSEARPYQYHLSTEQIAVSEWKAILRNAKQKSKPAKRILPSPYELLLFSPCPRPVTVLASYPRSGNSLLRNLFERATLRITGSDMRGGLTQHDLVGEAAVSARQVQFVKTHFPERRGRPVYPASRAVLLVRNPYDAIESYFNLMMTNTHTSSIAPHVRQKYKQLWEEMVLKEIVVWKEFHEYWLDQRIPLLVIKYEDLVKNTDKVLRKVVSFVLEINHMGFFAERIGHCTREDIDQLGSYQPRSGGIGKSLANYSAELLQKMNIGIFSTMEKFGYSEMLVPEPEEWQLEPLDEYGVEIDPELDAIQPLAINAGKLVRGPELHTDWRAIRKELGDGSNVACKCHTCSQVR